MNAASAKQSGKAQPKSSAKPSTLGSFDTLRKLAAGNLTPSTEQPSPPTSNTVVAVATVEPLPATEAPVPILSASQQAYLGDTRGYELYDPEKVYQPGDRVLLPHDVLEPNPRNPRVFLVEAWAQELRMSIASSGQLESGLAYEKGVNGKFRMKGGHRREWALQSLGSEFMKFEIVKLNPSALEEYIQARALNKEHQTQTHIDDAFRFAELLADGLAPDQGTLARLLNISKSDMSKSLAIAEMPMLLLEPMAENIASFGLSSAYSVCRFWAQTEKNEERTLLLIKKVIEGRLSVRALEAMVKETTGVKAKPSARREQAVARSVFSGVGKGELKAYAAGKITMELSNLDTEKRDIAYTRILEVFKELGITSESGPPPVAE